MKKLILLVVLAVILVSFAGCNQDSSSDEVKVGFIYIGTVNDGGWTQAHEAGRQYLVDTLGVEALYKEEVPETADCIEAMSALIDQGCNVIMATSFGYMDYVLEIAEDYPDVIFMHNTGYKTAENVGTYFGKIYQPRYLSGIVAGLQTEANRIGYVAAFPIPEVIRGINAFALGVKSVNPDATVEVVWTNTWIDPIKARDAAEALLDDGVDVMAQHQDAPGPSQAAEEHGVWSVGYDVDQSNVAPLAHLTAPVFNWGEYYVELVKTVQEGTWTNEQYWGGLEDGVIGLAPLADFCHADAQGLVDEATAGMLDGSFNVFTGPITNQAGEEVVADGEVMDDGALLGMMFFVDNVIGELPAE